MREFRVQYLWGDLLLFIPVWATDERRAAIAGRLIAQLAMDALAGKVEEEDE